jgi:glycosyltransferase involved in cell wall biosynthesis
MPAFNAGKFIQKAVDSVFAQEYEHWELIIVDDGSTEPVELPAEQAERVKLIRVEHCGVSTARNIGLRNSTGEYVAFLDADDVWRPTKLKKQVALMTRFPEVGICHTGFGLIALDENPWFYDEIRALNAPYEAFESRPALELLGNGYICTSSVMVRRTALSVSGWFDPLLSYSEDWDLFLKLSAHFKLGYVPSCEIYYRKHDLNTSSNYELAFSQGKELLRRHQRFARSINRNDWLRAAVKIEQRLHHICSAIAFDQFRMHFRRREWVRCMRPFFDAFVMEPLFVIKSLLLVKRFSPQKPLRVSNEYPG